MSIYVYIYLYIGYGALFILTERTTGMRTEASSAPAASGAATPRLSIARPERSEPQRALGFRVWGLGFRV